MSEIVSLHARRLLARIDEEPESAYLAASEYLLNPCPSEEQARIVDEMCGPGAANLYREIGRLLMSDDDLPVPEDIAKRIRGMADQHTRISILMQRAAAPGIDQENVERYNQQIKLTSRAMIIFGFAQRSYEQSNPDPGLLND